MTAVQRIATIAVVLAVAVPAVSGQSASDLFQKALSKERVDGQFAEAIALYERVVTEAAGDRALAARALLQIGRCYERLGRDAQKTFERVITEFADQKSIVAAARSHLTAVARADPPKAASARVVWSGRGVVLEGAPSRDGRYLSALHTGSGDLAIRDLSTGTLRRVYAKPGDVRSGEFAEASMPSPDGARIAYQWFTRQNAYEVRTIGLHDARPRVLYSHPDNYSTPVGWSPDGKRVLALIGHERASQIAWISLADRSILVLRTLDWRWPGAARLSPDGRYIAYDFPAGDQDNRRDIFLLHADGSAQTTLIAHGANDVQPIWTPDGGAVLFTSDRSGTNGLWMIRVRDGRPDGIPVLVKPDVGQSRPLGFTANGAYYYGTNTGGSDVYTVPIDPDSHRPTGAPLLATEEFTGSNSSPDWSPDGRSLVFITQRGAAFGPSVDAGHLAIRSLESNQQRHVATPLRRFYRPRWSRDGALLVAAADPGGRLGWYRLDTATGGYERLPLSDDDEGASEVEWAGDARAVYYHLRDTAGSSIVRRSLADGVVTVLARFPATVEARGLSASPDGRYVAFRTLDPGSGETVLHAWSATGDAIELLRLSGQETIAASATGSPLVWTPSSDAVLFVKRLRSGHDTRAEVWKVSLATRRAESLGLSLPGLGGIRIRPDARALALSVLGGGAEVWVMENFLPR